MGCGCGERQVFMRKVVEGYRTGNRLMVKQNLQAMASSMKQDAAKLMVRIKPEVAKAYNVGVDNQRQN